MAERRKGALDRAPAKLLVSRKDSAAMLSMSVDHFERYVQPHLPFVKTGRLLLFPLSELEAWVERELVALSADA